MKNRFVSTLLKSRSILLLVGAVSLLAGCGRSDKVYPDRAGSLVGIDGRNPLPREIYDQSANDASVKLAADGTTSRSLAIQLKSDAGITNRALLGLSAFDEEKLDVLDGITFDSKIQSGSSNASVILVVDLNCSRANRKIRVVTATNDRLAAGVDQSNGYKRFTANFNAAIWTTMGDQPITDNGTILVPEVSAAPVSLADLIASTQKGVCVVNAKSGDKALPNVETSGILLSLSSATKSELFINRITVGTKIIDEKTWGQQ